MALVIYAATKPHLAPPAEEIVTDVLDRIPAGIDSARSETPDMPAAYVAVIHEQIERVRRLAA